jgi:hypothetical protein
LDNEAQFSKAEEPTSKLVSEINSHVSELLQQRKDHEPSWFVNAAILRGDSYVTWDATTARLSTPPAPNHRVRLRINRVRPKYKAYLAKFFKGRPKPEILPASTDREDLLNARSTERALDYIFRKQSMEAKYKRAKLWTGIASKGYWWFSWNENSIGRVRTEDPLLGVKDEEAVLGDVEITVGTPFEVLVSDPTQSRIADQPKIYRITRQPLKDVQQRHSEFAEQIKPDTSTSDAMGYANRIASLRTYGSETGSGSATKEPANTHVTVKEMFVKPCGEYPKGMYACVAGDVLVKNQPELPYGFWDMENPYPVVEFTDSAAVGQYWGTTIVEQLTDLQREYNLLRSKVAENIRMLSHPKIQVFTQHRLSKSAWTDQAGEIIEVWGVPGLPPPQIIQPPNIAADVWQSLSLIRQEFDDLTQIYPASEGKVGSSTSGFQTNLLQEAADSVHGPDIREDELAMEDAFRKIRRIIAKGYDIPRLITVVGKNSKPEVLEFSNRNIDEYADLKVQIGSMLPDLKSAKIQALLELGAGGWLGNPQDPDDRRKFVSRLEMGGIELTMEEERSDEDQAWRENTEFEQSGTPMKPAEFFENHRMHEQVHGMLLKSASALEWPPEKRIALIDHLLSHAMFLNPQVAQQLKVQYGLAPPMPVISQMPPSGPAAPPGAPPQAPPAPGAPAPIPPPGGAAMAPPPPQ